MEYNGKHYYKIDVPHIRDGYSFMVVSNDELDELDVLHKAYLNGCFDDAPTEYQPTISYKLTD